MRLLFLLIVYDGGVFIVSLYFVEGLVNFIDLRKNTANTCSTCIKSVICSQEGVAHSSHYLMKTLHFIQKPIGCRLHASSWWPVDSIAHMRTVSNF